jgi:hypothetical protein
MWEEERNVRSIKVSMMFSVLALVPSCGLHVEPKNGKFPASQSLNDVVVGNRKAVKITGYGCQYSGCSDEAISGDSSELTQNDFRGSDFVVTSSIPGDPGRVRGTFKGGPFWDLTATWS